MLNNIDRLVCSTKVLFLLVTSVSRCPTHIVLCFLFVFPRLVYSMLLVSLDFPFVIATPVFSNVYYVFFSLMLT
jgi:hypothetical protein